jgi:histidine triad (HIT) family protein
MSDCVFCQRIASGDYERVSLYVARFEPLNPVTSGHMLFIPKNHYHDAGHDPNMTGVVFAAAARYAEETQRPFNLITSAGTWATQSVFHLHVHFIPRRDGDGLHLPWTEQAKP